MRSGKEAEGVVFAPLLSLFVQAVLTQRHGSFVCSGRKRSLVERFAGDLYGDSRAPLDVGRRSDPCRGRGDAAEVVVTGGRQAWRNMWGERPDAGQIWNLQHDRQSSVERMGVVLRQGEVRPGARALPCLGCRSKAPTRFSEILLAGGDAGCCCRPKTEGGEGWAAVFFNVGAN